ncbi:TetR/AcrR family transcriptional regulator [Endozoicomonas numazuensis]|uniref:TetR family transcriptional regulator n=1 Tax=Endozoicomonas numazuensis TaxID=1137799 RepID=A0A081NGZ1_9GAMM|nr:TetR/AcrR family transcriptional regulator [Endozoicomonas numazuensis]KEQ17714.1 TetR family transcriptional regulator [Endozoicomonas numazuensis]
MQSSAAKVQQTAVKSSRVRQKNIQVILQAAEDEFVLSGFKGASIRDIANRAGLPKANVHYYFNSKVDLYSAVLSHIMELWEAVFSGLNKEDDPASAFRQYIQAKMQYCLAHANASRIFSSEIIHGGQHLKEHFEHFKAWIKEKSLVIESWVQQGKMDPVDPLHLLFTIWATTQYYVDYSPQVACVIGKEALSEEDLEAATEHLCNLIIKGCGIRSS